MRQRPTGRPRVSAWSTFTGAEAYPRPEHSLVLVVVLLLLTAKGFVRGRAGHSRIAIRGIDVATQTIGIRQVRTKLLARP